MNPIFWYELCFYGDEDTSSKAYDPKLACSYVIKTEIPPVISDETALDILFGKDTKEQTKEWRQNLTCIMQVTEDEAKFFDVEDLVIRVESELGVYYKRK